jgi:hypothetical protein
VAYNNTYKRYNEITELMEGENEDYGEAMRIAKMTDRIKLGVIYKKEKAPYHAGLQPSLRLERDKRIALVEEIVKTDQSEMRSQRP